MIKSKPKTPTQIITEVIPSQGFFPNNNQYPLLIYKSVFSINQLSSSGIKSLLKHNLWGNVWLNGIYDYHHYHSNTHEVLVIIAGWCNVMYGGPKGKIYKISQGDVVIHPAGVSHKRENASENFACIGAYPNSVDYDMCYGKKEEHPIADIKIRSVHLPSTDPIFGNEVLLYKYWPK